MKTISIPETDLSPSLLCMGSGDFGAGIDRETAFDLMDHFVEAGGTFIDTAKIYNDWVPGETSRSEKMIGRWMISRANRSKIVLATKGAHFDLQTPHIPRLSAVDILGDIQQSLRNLQTDHIDLYWLHRDDPSRPVEDILRPLHEAQQAGLIRWYGASNWRLDRLQAAREAARANQWSGFCAVQNLWNLASVTPGGIADPTIVTMDDGLWAFHQSTRTAAIPFSSQANGLFQKLAAGQNDTLPESLRSTYSNKITEQRFVRLLALQRMTGLTVTQIVLGYLIAQPFPTIPVFSARNLAQLDDTLTAADVRLTEDQRNFLTE